ncbi:MAG: 50S ribosomal protein L13 [Candidatus Woesearchaeota archaeon]|nr:50S ribosomal protein L13 [Candidatus Woesearchaeota archaeon]
MIINAENLIVGRIATAAAKKALLGENVDIVNCEKAVIVGNRKQILEKFKQRADRGAPLKGPYYPRMPDRLLRRIIRGMLPFKTKRGKEAFKRIMCHMGVPEQFRNIKTETISKADVSKKQTLDYVTIEEISRFMGAKI